MKIIYINIYLSSAFSKRRPNIKKGLERSWMVEVLNYLDLFTNKFCSGKTISGTDIRLWTAIVSTSAYKVAA